MAKPKEHVANFASTFFRDQQEIIGFKLDSKVYVPQKISFCWKSIDREIIHLSMLRIFSGLNIHLFLCPNFLFFILIYFRERLYDFMIFCIIMEKSILTIAKGHGPFAFLNSNHLFFFSSMHLINCGFKLSFMAVKRREKLRSFIDNVESYY